MIGFSTHPMTIRICSFELCRLTDFCYPRILISFLGKTQAIHNRRIVIILRRFDWLRFEHELLHVVHIFQLVVLDECFSNTIVSSSGTGLGKSYMKINGFVKYAVKNRPRKIRSNQHFFFRSKLIF